MAEKVRPCESCDHAQVYNEDWCVCWHDAIKGSKVQMRDFCIVKALQEQNGGQLPNMPMGVFVAAPMA